MEWKIFGFMHTLGYNRTDLFPMPLARCVTWGELEALWSCFLFSNEVISEVPCPSVVSPDCKLRVDLSCIVRNCFVGIKNK